MGGKVRCVLCGPTGQDQEERVGWGARPCSIQEGNAQHPESVQTDAPSPEMVRVGDLVPPSDVDGGVQQWWEG